MAETLTQPTTTPNSAAEETKKQESIFERFPHRLRENSGEVFTVISSSALKVWPIKSKTNDNGYTWTNFGFEFSYLDFPWGDTTQRSEKIIVHGTIWKKWDKEFQEQRAYWESRDKAMNLIYAFSDPKDTSAKKSEGKKYWEWHIDVGSCAVVPVTPALEQMTATILEIVKNALASPNGEVATQQEEAEYNPF